MLAKVNWRRSVDDEHKHHEEGGCAGRLRALRSVDRSAVFPRDNRFGRPCFALLRDLPRAHLTEKTFGVALTATNYIGGICKLPMPALI